MDGRVRHRVPAYPHHRTLARTHLLALLFFVVVAVDVSLHGPLESTDVAFGSWVDERTGPAFESFGRAVLSAPGHTESAIVLMLAGFALCMYMGVSRNAWTIILAGTVGMLLIPVLKIAFARPRPSIILETGAFPSGHALKAAFIVGLVFALTYDAYVRRQKGFEGKTAPGWLPASLVGVWVLGTVSTMVGRVVGDVHWWTDTLGGVLLGLVMLTGVLFLHATLPATVREEVTDEMLAER